jgi:hypothetical protein
MSAEAEKSPPTPTEPAVPPPARIAWQPLTFGGVAAFANARWRRLLLAQGAVALLFGAAAVWFLGHRYAPVITDEFHKMPVAAGLAGGQLTGLGGVTISESKFLSIAITGNDNAELDQSADVQIALRRDHVEISSILSSALGSLEMDYPRGWTMDLSRPHLEPWWGAWRPVMLVAAGLAVAVWLLPLWWLLALVYAPAAKLMAWFLNRQLTWAGAWRLGCAALLPGAVLLAAGLVLYGGQMVDVFGLGYFGGVHLLVGWVYLLAAPAFAPRSSAQPARRNPFSS